MVCKTVPIWACGSIPQLPTKVLNIMKKHTPSTVVNIKVSAPFVTRNLNV